MPVYEYKCPKGHRFERVLKIANYLEPQTCECGEIGKKLISKPMIAPMFEDYQSPIDGSPITTIRKRNNDLAKSGCIEYEPGMRQDADRLVKENDRKMEKEIDHTVEKIFSEMPTRKLEKLESELRAGADIVYERKGVE